MLATVAIFIPIRWSNSSDLGHYWSIKPFSFVGRDGKPVTDRDLSGKVCVFACFFTCCTESCPQLSAAMAKLQKELADLKDVRLVSLTVDPDHDKPEILNSYAETFGAKPDRWLFVTTKPDDVKAFVKDTLKLGLDENAAKDHTPGNKMLHSNKLVLVDRMGEIRGFFDGTSPAEVDALTKAIRQLHNQ